MDFARELRDTYAALNRNDIEAAVKPFDAQIGWIEPAEYTGSATCHGLAEVKAHLTRARGTWAAVYTFRNGKATEMRIFDDTQQALEWVGAPSGPEDLA